jgi:hypothetical protein
MTRTSLIYSALGLVLIAGTGILVLHSQKRTDTQKATPNSGEVVITQDQDVPPGFVAPTQQPPNDTQPIGELKPHRAAPPGQLEYYDSAYRFSVFYPSNLSVQTYDEGEGAKTITFQDAAVSQGFQIFVSPYGARQVTSERFKEDVPSGVMQDPLNITINGVNATSFYSTNSILGNTAEIWFIHGGYLFEVTTFKSLAPWLSGIMGTWEFI